MSVGDRAAQPTRTLWRDRVLGGAVVLFFGWCVVAISWPLSGDAGVFAWMADTVHRGNAPYVAAWDTKGPAAWLPSLLMQLLTGRNAWGIRAFDITMVVAAVVAIRNIAIRLAQPGDGRIAIALYLLWYASLDFWHSAQPDGWVAAWLIVACALALTGRITGAFAAGALVGLSTMTKPFYIGYLVVLWIIVWTHPESVRRSRSGNALCVCLGALCSVGASVVLLRATSGFDAYLEVQRWNRDVYAGLSNPWLTRIPVIIKGALVMPWGIVGPLALFGAVRPTRLHRRTIAALTVGLMGAIAGVLLQGRGWMYHWLPMLPFLALLADIGFASLRSETAGEIAGRFRFLALLLALGVAAIAPAQTIFRYARSRASAEDRRAYEEREFRYYGRYPGSVYAIVDSLRATAPSPPSILVWAMQLAPQFLDGLTVPTRYAVIRPLFDGPTSAFRAQYRADFERHLRDAPPRYWLVPTEGLASREEEIRAHDVASYANAASVLREQYRRAGQTADWLIFERVSPGPP